MKNNSKLGLIIKLTEKCNYSCNFCRYANSKDEKLVFTSENLKRIIFMSVQWNLNKNNKNISLIFHGGEPLLWGKNNFKETIEYEKEMSEKFGVFFKNSIQTNGYLIDEEWINIFVDGKFDIGVSIDGPEELNGHVGPLGSNFSLKKVLANIKLLESQNIPFGILAVITPNHVTKVKEFYNFFIQNQIKNIGLCYCYNPIDNKNVVPKDLSIFLIQLFDLYFYQKNVLRIREFDNAIRKYLTGKSTTCAFSNRESCGQYYTVRANGDILFCDSYELNTSPIGNAFQNDLRVLINDDYINNLKIRTTLKNKKCKNCIVKNICGMGCYRHDIQNGIEINNYFCETYLELYSHIKKCLDEYKKLDNQNEYIYNDNKKGGGYHAKWNRSN